MKAHITMVAKPPPRCLTPLTFSQMAHNARAQANGVPIASP